MPVSVTWRGLAELSQELHALPMTLTHEAEPIVESIATDTAERIRAAYPVRTGRLRDGVSAEVVPQDQPVVLWVVRNTSPLAYLFEHGTHARHTALGANRGAMPPGHVFYQPVDAASAEMVREVKALVAEQGFQVSGEGEYVAAP